jgi:hypothetical protein
LPFFERKCANFPRAAFFPIEQGVHSWQPFTAEFDKQYLACARAAPLDWSISRKKPQIAGVELVYFALMHDGTHATQGHLDVMQKIAFFPPL